jgi:hypothetical protein
MLAAIRRASSRVICLVAAPAPRLLLEIDAGERLPVAVADDEAGVRFFDDPGRRGSGAAEAWRNQVFDRAAACGKACG